MDVLMLAAVGGMFMAVNFHLANGGKHPCLIPRYRFNETIDIDAMLIVIQGAHLGFCGYLLARIRREHQAAAIPAEVPPAPSLRVLSLARISSPTWGPPLSS